MITRTEQGILITPEDIPALAGIMGGWRGHWEREVRPKVPGSFEPFADAIESAMDRLDKALTTKVE